MPSLYDFLQHCCLRNPNPKRPGCDGIFVEEEDQIEWLDGDFTKWWIGMQGIIYTFNVFCSEIKFSELIILFPIWKEKGGGGSERGIVPWLLFLFESARRSLTLDRTGDSSDPDRRNPASWSDEVGPGERELGVCEESWGIIKERESLNQENMKNESLQIYPFYKLFILRNKQCFFFFGLRGKTQERLIVWLYTWRNSEGLAGWWGQLREIGFWIFLLMILPCFDLLPCLFHTTRFSLSEPLDPRMWLGPLNKDNHFIFLLFNFIGKDSTTTILHN